MQTDAMQVDTIQYPKNSRSKRLRRLFPFFLYLFLGLLILGPVLSHPFSSFIGGTGDPQQFMWYLGWFWHAILHGWNPFHLRLLDAPVGQNAMWNTSIFAESFLFGPLTWIVNATFTYNLLWLANFVASCWIGEKMVRRLGVRPWLAVCGGVLMGVIPYSTAQTLYHIHLWTTSLVLGMLYMLIAGHQSGLRRPVLFGLGLGILAAFEFYTSIEVFATMTLIGFIVLAFALIVLPRQVVTGLRWPQIKALGTAVLFVMVCAAPGIYEMFHGASRPHGALLPAGIYVNDLLNFFLPTPVYWLHTAETTLISHKYTGNFWENDGYLGFAAMLLFLITATTVWRHRLARVGIYACLCIALLSMGPFLHVGGHITRIRLPWLLLQQVPLIDSALPSRIMFYGDILLVILFVFGIEHMYRTQRLQWLRGLSVGLLFLTFVTWMPTIPYPHSETPAAAKALRSGSPVYTVVRGTTTYVLTDSTPDTMQSVAEGGFPFAMVNPYGYTGNTWSRNHALRAMTFVLSPGLSQSQVEELLRSGLPGLQADRLLYFPLNPGEQLTASQYQAITQVLGTPMAQDAGAIVWNIRP